MVNKMKEKYAKKLIEILSKRYGIKIHELKSSEGIVTKWCSYIEQLDTLIFFTDSFNVLSNFEILDFTRKGTKVIKIILSDGNIGYQEENSLVIDYLNSQIIYSNVEENINRIIKDSINSLKKPKSKLDKKAKVTYTLIAINIFMYIITAILSKNVFTSDINVLIYLGAKYNPLIREGQYYRLITCGFLHGGLIHVALNMYALYAIGPIVETFIGKFKYIIIYFSSLILSSLFSFIFSEGVSIGASGAIFGLFGACLIIGIKNKSRIGKGFYQNILSVIIVNLILGFTISNIDNFAHVGGLIAGIGITFILMKKETA